MHVHTSVHRHTHTLSYMPRSPAPSLPEHLGLVWSRLREPGYPQATKGTTSVHWTTGVKATPRIPSRELGDLAAVTIPQGMWFSREVNGSGLPSAGSSLQQSVLSLIREGGDSPAGSVPGCRGGGGLTHGVGTRLSRWWRTHSPTGSVPGCHGGVPELTAPLCFPKSGRESREQSPLGKPSHGLKTGLDRGPGAVGGWCSAEDPQGHEAGGL